VSSFKYFGKI